MFLKMALYLSKPKLFQTTNLFNTICRDFKIRNVLANIKKCLSKLTLDSILNPFKGIVQPKIKMCSSSGHPSWNRGHQCKSVATVILRVLKKAYQGTQHFVIWIRWQKLPYMPRERLGPQKISSGIFGPWGPLLQSELPIYTMSVEIHTRARVCFYVCVYLLYIPFQLRIYKQMGRFW